jgi:hypothetical protein
MNNGYPIEKLTSALQSLHAGIRLFNDLVTTNLAAASPETFATPWPSDFRVEIRAELVRAFTYQLVVLHDLWGSDDWPRSQCITVPAAWEEAIGDDLADLLAVLSLDRFNEWLKEFPATIERPRDLLARAQDEIEGIAVDVRAPPGEDASPGELIVAALTNRSGIRIQLRAGWAQVKGRETIEFALGWLGERLQAGQFVQFEGPLPGLLAAREGLTVYRRVQAASAR